jgi:hypothetical protein
LATLHGGRLGSARPCAHEDGVAADDGEVLREFRGGVRGAGARFDWLAGDHAAGVVAEDAADV